VEEDHGRGDHVGVDPTEDAAASGEVEVEAGEAPLVAGGIGAGSSMNPAASPPTVAAVALATSSPVMGAPL